MHFANGWVKKEFFLDPSTRRYANNEYMKGASHVGTKYICA